MNVTHWMPLPKPTGRIENEQGGNAPTQGKHTTGPWEWWTSNSWRRLRHSDRGVSTNVLYPFVQADIDVSTANMALIAAAPDLLAAILNSDDAHWTPAMHAAIAKATGRTENEQTRQMPDKSREETQ